MTDDDDDDDCCQDIKCIVDSALPANFSLDSMTRAKVFSWTAKCTVFFKQREKETHFCRQSKADMRSQVL